MTLEGHLTEVGTATPPTEAEVVIVGFGPVGQILAALLGRAGHRVVVVERHARPYPLPRAIHFDHEVMRILQGVGIAEDLEPLLVASDHYLWHGADGELILDLDTSQIARSGWRADYTFFQPDLESRLIAEVHAQPSVTVVRGWEVEEVNPGEASVTLTLRRGEESEPGRWVATQRTVDLRAAYVVGADGAGSRVRAELDVAERDLGFAERWLVVDVKPHDPATLLDLPVVAQYCDPRRPTVCVRNGRLHQRWEFMLLPGEEPEAFIGDQAGVWRLLEPWIDADQATIVRAASYTFRSCAVARMRIGRVLLAGDAAHQMPPHMGQGMCAGLRDAQNLAWKLSLVLSGRSPDALLDSYETERRAQNEGLIAISLQMGRVSCETDPARAAARDAAMRSGEMPPPPPPPELTEGLLLGDDAIAGTLSVQGRVMGPAGPGLLDDVLGGSFALLLADGDPSAVLSPEDLAFLHSIGAVARSLRGDGLRDEDGRMTGWLAEAQVVAVLVRPDFYVFGSARAATDVGGLVDALRQMLAEPAVLSTS